MKRMEEEYSQMIDFIMWSTLSDYESKELNFTIEITTKVVAADSN